MKYIFGSSKYDLASRTHIMGILNVTPDSFSDGGRYYSVEEGVSQGLKLVDEGADFLDIGGESSRPGSEPISVEEEIRRVIPVIEKLALRIGIPISIDTYKSKVAEAALRAGAVLVNDISATTFDPAMRKVISDQGASVILMHMQGSPKTMQNNPEYKNVVQEVKSYLYQHAEEARRAGIQQIILDPGIGFGKMLEHNIQLLQELHSFTELGYPILVGPSRKSFLGKILNLPPGERLEGTSAAVTVSVLHGASIIRVHDVKEMKRIALVSDALKKPGGYIP